MRVFGQEKGGIAAQQREKVVRGKEKRPVRVFDLRVRFGVYENS